jgi:hypothetical protein
MFRAMMDRPLCPDFSILPSTIRLGLEYMSTALQPISYGTKDQNGLFLYPRVASLVPNPQLCNGQMSRMPNFRRDFLETI